MTAIDILNYILEISRGRIKLNHIVIGRTLATLGYVKSQKHTKEYPIKGYYINTQN